MFQVQPFQIAVLNEDARIRRVATQLRRNQVAVARDLPDSTLHALVAKGIARAAEFGLEDGPEVGSFVALLFVIGPAFYRQRTIHALLTNAGEPPAARWRNLFARTSEQDWEEAQMLDDGAFWATTG